MLKIATSADTETIERMASEFARNTDYAEFVDASTISELIQHLLNDTRSIILLHGEEGMLAGTLSKFPLGPYLIASEIAWWVNPDKRKSNIGSELLEAFEFWAAKVGASFVQMASIDDRVGKYYENKGYKLYERAYMKGI